MMLILHRGGPKGECECRICLLPVLCALLARTDHLLTRLYLLKLYLIEPMVL